MDGDTSLQSFSNATISDSHAQSIDEDALCRPACQSVKKTAQKCAWQMVTAILKVNCGIGKDAMIS
jgi:hypothetical protein